MSNPSATTRPAEVGAVVALKRVEHAKSRLSPMPDPLRRRLAWTMAVDTLRALEQAVTTVVVVTNEPGLELRLSHEQVSVEVLAEPAAPGLNAALHHGAAHLQGAGHEVIMAAVADLPALRPESVRAVLAASAPHPRSFVADTGGTGTTLLIARRVDLDPQFQGRSAAAHKLSGAAALAGSFPQARRDVDTEVDLADAIRLGVGAATASLVATNGRLGAFAMITVVRADNGDLIAVDPDGTRYRLAAEHLPDLAPGARLNAVIEDGRALAVWG